LEFHFNASQQLDTEQKKYDQAASVVKSNNYSLFSIILNKDSSFLLLRSSFEANPSNWKMGCGNLFFTILITFSVALITYNIIISANAPLKQDFPGPSRPSISVDPLIKMPLHRSSSQKKRLFHTAVTASDSVYNTWQCRVMYFWYNKFKDGPQSGMGGFTRILHSGKPDQFMDEIPTFVAQPLPAGMDQVLLCFFHNYAFWVVLGVFCCVSLLHCGCSFSQVEKN